MRLTVGFRLVVRFVSVLALLTLPVAARAAVSVKDIQVAARALGFTTNPPSGNVKLGIVYDPANAASAADEQALLGILGSGLAVGGVTLVPEPVTVSQLGTASMQVMFLTGGLGGEAAQAQSYAVAKKILCMTTDMAATQAGDCALGIQTDPKVVITVNTSAASDTDVSFASAFMLMITEI